MVISLYFGILAKKKNFSTDFAKAEAECQNAI
jgi:hypothetical protein